MLSGDTIVMEGTAFDALLRALREHEYETVGPTVRDGAIVYDEVREVSDLPRGQTDEQAGGHYRLHRGVHETLFSYAVGPHSWKRYLRPPSQVLWRARRVDRGFVAEIDAEPPPRYAFVGMRPCELAALLVQDRVFLGDAFPDPDYRGRRESAFLLVVNCGAPAGTCFCASVKTGPRAGPGFDLALTELSGDGRHDFLIEVGSPRGAEIAEGVPHRPAETADIESAEALVREAEGRMGRTLETEGLKERLGRSYEDPHWDEVAKRCLACANCTMVCPTCFCTTVEDGTDLTGQPRRAAAASGTPASPSISPTSTVAACALRRGARYRQWMTHKLAIWHDQFGVSGLRRLRPLHHLVPGGHRHHRGGPERSTRAKPAEGADGEDPDL